MQNMTIAARITLGFALLLVALAVTSLLAFIGLGSISSRVEDVSTHELAFYRDVVGLQQHMGNLRRFEKDYFINMGDAAKRAEYSEKWNKTIESAHAAIKNAGTHPLNGDATQQLTALDGLLNSYADGFKAVAAKVDKQELAGTSDANKAFGQYKSSIHQMEEVSAKLAKGGSDAVAQLRSQIDASADAVRSQLLATVAIGLLASLVVSWYIIRSIRVPLLQMRDSAQQLAQTCDLNLKLPDFGRNELGSVGESLASLVGTVRRLVQEAQGHATQLANASGQMADVSSQVSGAAANQAESAASGAAAIEQMSVSINLVADNTRDVEDQARQTMAQADRGNGLAEKAASEIQRIASGITETSTVMDQLNQRSSDIGDIVRVIRDIADQTNLLALNAAIEAARAGEMGRGFAVVADEVRKLAERTSQATTEISTHIEGVQTDTQRAYQSMQQANARIESGVSSTSSVAESLREIHQLSQHSVERISDIANAIKEQSHASQLVAGNVEQMAQMNESTAKASGQASRLSQELQQLSVDLDSNLRRFRT
ncbi:methyl-accepting chemotaxis protein [Chromobacterium haemolyticum]|uniref:Methyl-accepting chemotaxis protein n=1 Tax=Chromobacterium haemolyticum TaxID=394935 RepID=A0A1W0D984_9NEIS|nr:methyl-accepting chemotaxis protein [Chromobacterium haemolyticum]OQS43581.1 hypothetical protein B0T45_02400 [Chromobacterium haemolyticum]